MIVVDTSTSMNERINLLYRKIDAAKAAAINLIEAFKNTDTIISIVSFNETAKNHGTVNLSGNGNSLDKAKKN